MLHYNLYLALTNETWLGNSNSSEKANTHLWNVPKHNVQLWSQIIHLYVKGTLNLHFSHLWNQRTITMNGNWSHILKWKLVTCYDAGNELICLQVFTLDD